MNLDDLNNLQINLPADPEELGLLEKIRHSIDNLYAALSKPLKIIDPISVKGEVKVNALPAVKINSLPSVEINNLSELEMYFKTLESRIGDLARAISNVPAPKVEFPKIEFPKYESAPIDFSEITNAIQSLEGSLTGLNSSADTLNVLRLVQDGIQELVRKPQFIPPTVTKVDINPLRGQVDSTLVTVGVTPTPLPGNAAIRRQSLIIFNEDTSTTLRIGGAAVVASGGNGSKVGLAVPPQTYSPPIGAGPNMIVYGIVSSGTINVTVLEVEGDYITPGGPSAGMVIGGVNV